jgi:hypothetical protein
LHPIIGFTLRGTDEGSFDELVQAVGIGVDEMRSAQGVPHARKFLKATAPGVAALTLLGGVVLATGQQVASGSVQARTTTLKEVGWSATATQFRGKVGSRHTYACPSRGALYTVWGTDVYTDDSSVCSAAVNAGRITLARGGMVFIQMRAGRTSYKASNRHGVTTRSYGTWYGSYVITGATPGTITVTLTGGSGWSATATAYRGLNSLRFSYTCPAGGSLGTVWGTNIYTDDSSVCTAAVHAGRIGATSGGTVVIAIRPGQSSYTGTTRNKVTTRSYGTWYGSYVLVG